MFPPLPSTVRSFPAVLDAGLDALLDALLGSVLAPASVPGGGGPAAAHPCRQGLRLAVASIRGIDKQYYPIFNALLCT